MVLEGVTINKLRRTYKVLSVNGQQHNLARFKLASTAIRILSAKEDEPSPHEDDPGGGGGSGGGELVLTDVPGLATQVRAINSFLRGFRRPFWIPQARESCGLVIHGGHGTGKTMILQRLAATGWGRVHWIRPSDKLAAIRETFRQAVAQAPSMVLIDALEELIVQDRGNRDAVIEAIADELDALSRAALAPDANRLPRVVVVATCLDYMTDVPAKLQKRSRLRENVALPIPRAAERLEILRFLDPPLPAGPEKETCLAAVAQKTHAYNGDDLANLVLGAKRIMEDRMDESGVEQETAGEQFLSVADMEQALRVTRPTAMHDINLKPPTIHWQDVGGQDGLKKVLSRMIKKTKVGRLHQPSPLLHLLTVIEHKPVPSPRCP
jgi:AAA family ATPase